MEPLRRPQERRRVPPLRIRLPKRREVRKRVPARSRDYSPPGRTFRRKLSRNSAVPQQESVAVVQPAARKSRRSSRLIKTSNAQNDHVG
ncbi:unnamed protein product [Enterobius vermicularis]|uniref:Uncharacterized protein n=1 Tax=Enterobius vermicularis TaxID=51028 RepID=A0A0N4V1W9_ENTVE|nr:unnamed protein product [Enterobius vermicularis]